MDLALERTVAELGPVSILVNNAGGVFSSPLLETTENGWDALYRANLKHVILCTQRVARVMVAHGIGGSIMSVTSIEGVRAAPGYAAYAAAKAGRDQLHQDRRPGAGAARHPGQRAGPRHHHDRGASPPWHPRRHRGAVRPHGAHGQGRATSTRWRAPRSSWPASCPATSPARPSTSTAGPRRPAGGTTSPDGRLRPRPVVAGAIAAQPSRRARRGPTSPRRRRASGR